MKCSKSIKILVELMHGLGDTVCALPMLQLLRSTFPDGEITVLTKFSGANDIIKSSGIYINHIICFDIYKDWRKSIFILRDLRGIHFDIGVSSCITPVKKAKMFMKIVKPKCVVGLQNDNLNFDSLGDKYHFVEANLLAVKKICNIPSQKIYPRIYPDTQCVNRLRQKIGNDNLQRKIVGVCIGNADYSLKNRFFRKGRVYTRSWGSQNMTTLIDLLRQQEDLIIILIGGNQEIRLMEYIREHISMTPKIIDFVGKTTLQESIALVSLCQCVFGVDTGMQHVASAVGTKTISVFGPTNPKTHGAYANNAIFLTSSKSCSRQFCYGSSSYVDCPNQRVCLSTIKPNRAFNAIINALSTDVR